MHGCEVHGYKEEGEKGEDESETGKKKKTLGLATKAVKATTAVDLTAAEKAVASGSGKNWADEFQTPKAHEKGARFDRA